MQWIHGPLGVDSGASLLLALVLVGGVAWTLHQLAEDPGIRLGRRLSAET